MRCIFSGCNHPGVRQLDHKGKTGWYCSIHADMIESRKVGHTHDWQDNEGHQGERLHRLSYREMLEGLQTRRQFMIDHQLTSKANWQHMIQLMEIEKAIEYFTRKAEEER